MLRVDILNVEKDVEKLDGGVCEYSYKVYVTHKSRELIQIHAGKVFHERSNGADELLQAVTNDIKKQRRDFFYNAIENLGNKGE